MDRCYSTIEIKSFDEEKRTFEGVASTPTADRGEDTVNPLGAVFKLPLPMLWAHGKGSIKDPVGWITHATPMKDGIPVRGQMAIPKDDYPQSLKDELNGAWVKVRDKIVRGLSIGFKPLESEPIKGTYGTNYKRWEWLELSPVPIAMNAEASISLIKSIDQQQRAPGDSLPRSVRLEKPPAAAGAKSKGTQVKTYAERIKDLEATRAAKAARMKELMEKSGDEGRSTEQAEGEEVDTIETEIKQIDADIRRWSGLEKLNAEQAKPIEAKDTKAASESRSLATVKTVEKTDPGIRMARFVMCLAAAKGDLNSAFQISQSQYPNDEAINSALKGAAEMGSSTRLVVHKSAVTGGTTVGTTWAAPLVAYNQFAGDFIEFLRPQTIIGKFGTNGVPSLRKVPFNVHIRGQTTGGTGYWVGEGAPKPVTSFGFNDVYLGYTKVANIAVITEELIRFSDPSAETFVRDALKEACIERIDTDFVDPTKTLVASVSPASITNGAPNSTSSGNTAAAIRADVATLWGSAMTANMPVSSAVYITDAATALGLSLLQNPLGQQEFPGVGMNGGTFMGVPMIVSNYLPQVSSGSIFILAFASEIFLADDGQVSVVASREASIQMDNAPSNNSATGAGSTMVSMFQTDSVALRAERFINWQKRRATAVAYLTGVDWGG